MLYIKNIYFTYNLKRCINEALSYISQDSRNLMMSEAVTRSGE